MWCHARSAPLLAVLFACGGAASDTEEPIRTNPRDAGNTVARDAGSDARDGGVAMNDVCPAMGPFGSREGDVLANITLPDCDGNRHALHELCERQASWIYTFAGW